MSAMHAKRIYMRVIGKDSCTAVALVHIQVYYQGLFNAFLFQQVIGCNSKII